MDKPTLGQQSAMASYVKTIRNADKKLYAQRYWLYLTGSPEQPERGGLSAMAAQAVRMNLEVILNRMEVSI